MIYNLPSLSHKYGLIGDLDNSKVKIFTKPSKTPGESKKILTFLLLSSYYF
jgi:hypothetical protein